MPPLDECGRYLAASFAFVFDDRNRFLLLRELEDRRKYMYDLPGGTLGVDEEPVAGLRREVAEETGLEIELRSPLCHLKWDRHDSGLPILVAFYVARAVGPAEVRTSVEHEGFRWVTPQEYHDEKLTVSLANEDVLPLLNLTGAMR